MTDAETIAHRYIELWNETTAERRRAILAANWTSDATYVDPLMSGAGHAGIDTMIAGVQQQEDAEGVALPIVQAGTD